MTYEKHAPALVQLVAAAKQSLRLCLRIASTDGCTIFFLRSLLTSTSTSSLPGEARPGEVGVRQMRFAVCLPEGGLLFDGRGSTANALRCLPTGRADLLFAGNEKYGKCASLFAYRKGGFDGRQTGFALAYRF